MRTLVVFYSLEGNTSMVSKKIAEYVSADVLELKPTKSYPTGKASKFIWGGKAVVFKDKPKLCKFDTCLSDYDLIIYATPVWASSFVPPFRTFFDEHKSVLLTKKCAFVACQAGNGAEKCFNEMSLALDGKKPEATLILIDPLKKPSEENDSRIDDFCKKVIVG